jgi:predicted ATPase
MKITRIRLKNFKRFTDLTVRNIPPTAKLVVIVGPNGCGKSSLFDGLFHWYRLATGHGIAGDNTYFQKDAAREFDWHSQVEVSTAGGAAVTRGSLYVRTAYRNEADFSISQITTTHNPTEQLRFQRLIDPDTSVSNNYQRLVHDTMAAVYDMSNDAKTVANLREELIGAIRTSMKNVFGDLLLNNIANPLQSGTFQFQKGSALSYQYKNLSGGEKAAFDLLLDLHLKRKFYADAIYCIDELETHLHTKVQGALLKELYAVLPSQSQLWVSTHSLGVLRAAQELTASAPGSVCIIDFHGVDPDEPREIVPSALGRVSWEKLLSLTLDDLSQRIAPRWIVICEGSTTGGPRSDFDAGIYNRVLGDHVADVFFVSGGNSGQVAASGANVETTLRGIFPHASVVALADRDDKSPAEVARFESTGNLVLGKRNLESYLLADDVIGALCDSVGQGALFADALKVKADTVAASTGRGNAPDDLKSAAGEIHVGLRRLLGLVGRGNNKDAFMRDTMAPLIQPPMQTYNDLKATILDRLPATS